MAVEIIDIRKEHWSAARLIGKRYTDAPDWGQWWENGWFAALETIPAHPMNADAFIGAVRIVGGSPEHWIGMYFPAETAVPEGFDHADIPPMDYAVCYLRDQEGSGEFYTMATHEMCLEALKARNLGRKEDDWCFERYACPGFTTPDEQGRVILDYGIAIV